MTTLTLISLFAIGVIAIVFNKKLKKARYEAKYNKEMLSIEKQNYTILEQAFTNQSAFVSDLLEENKRKSAKILDKNEQIEELKNQVK